MTLKEFILAHPNDELCIYCNGKAYQYKNVEDIPDKIIVEHFEMTLSGALAVMCRKKGWF